MQIEVEATERDHADFYVSYAFLYNWLKRWLKLVLVALVLALIIQRSNDNALWADFIYKALQILLVLFLLFFVIPYFRYRSKFDKAYMNSASPLSKKIFRTFAAGVDVEDETGNTFLRSADIKSVGKVGRYAYITLLNGDYYLLPARCFATNNQHFTKWKMGPTRIV